MYVFETPAMVTGCDAACAAVHARIAAGAYVDKASASRKRHESCPSTPLWSTYTVRRTPTSAGQLKIASAAAGVVDA
jgi:hypothetical protein